MYRLKAKTSASLGNLLTIMTAVLTLSSVAHAETYHLRTLERATLKRLSASEERSLKSSVEVEIEKLFPKSRVAKSTSADVDLQPYLYSSQGQIKLALKRFDGSTLLSVVDVGHLDWKKRYESQREVARALHDVIYGRFQIPSRFRDPALSTKDPLLTVVEQ